MAAMAALNTTTTGITVENATFTIMTDMAITTTGGTSNSEKYPERILTSASRDRYR
jgi:hypothetical protein